MRKGMIILGILAACACTHTRKAQVASAADYKTKDGTPVASSGQAKPGGKIICDNEAPVGTHIPEQRCYYQEDADAVRQETQDYLHGQPAKNTKPGG